MEYYARQIGVTGLMRNVGWNTVKAVTEDERDRVERFIEMMKQGPGASRAPESKVEWEDTTGEFQEFGIKRSK